MNTPKKNTARTDAGQAREKNARNQGAQFPQMRMRRGRTSPWMRDMLAENTLSPADLIYPVFLNEGENIEESIPSLPGITRTSIDKTLKHIEEAANLSIPAIALFPATPSEKKDETGSESENPFNLICSATRAIKKEFPEIGIVTDVALDPYTSHGHDGLLQDDTILNDETLEVLCNQAVNQAKAGADIIAPSDMMDGRVAAIRNALDNEGFEHVAIMSYAAKYASCFYGPFRDAVGSGGMLKGDKKTYQMNPANSDEAMREIELDINEGADMVMIKPGMPYLDVIQRTTDTFNIPTFAYQVSGEYAMLKMAAEHGCFEFESALLESLISFKRAGCRGIFTYGAIQAAKALKG